MTRISTRYSLGLVALSLLLLTVVSCADDDKVSEQPADDFDRAALLADLAGLIDRSYSDYSSEVAALAAAVDAFTHAPTQPTLQDLRSQWTATLTAWQYAAPYDFGPAALMALEAKTNIYPVSVSLIENNADGIDYTLQGASNRSAIGLQALDYLIHGDGLSDEEIIDAFSTDAGAGARTAYLMDVTGLLQTSAAQVAAEWKPNGSFRTDFVANDGTDQGSSLGLFLNALNRSFEKSTRTHKVGIPSGALTFSMTPTPEAVEAYYQGDRSVTYLRESVQAFEEIYLGTEADPISLEDYLIAIDARHGEGSLDAAIKSRFSSIYQRIDALEDPLSDFVVDDHEAVLDTFSELQAMVVLLKVDMMSSLGVLITYQDNDGD